MAEPPRKPTYEELEKELERLRAELKQVTALVEELRRAQHRPHAPFSKGPPKPDPKTPGRKPGDDYGKKAFRAIPPRIDETFEAPLPPQCPRCGGALELERMAEQYQTELPRIEPVYRKFNVAVGRCACCEKRVQGRHPLQTSNALGAAQSQVGANAQALVTRLNKHYGLSHGKAVGFLAELCHVTLSRGASAQIMLRAAERCGAAYREIQIVVRQSPWCVPDETGWKVGGALQWLHVFVTGSGPNELATLYLIRPSRGFDVAAEALGAAYDGDLTRDGWAPYDQFTNARQQQCLAHLIRRCNHLLETATRAAVLFPRKIKALLQEGLAVRDARDAGALSPRQASDCATVLTGKLSALCGRKTHAGNERLASFLDFHIGEIFNFLRRPQLDAANWRAEQAIRPAVVNRKVWGGNRTPVGANAQGVLMSVMRTAAQHGKDALQFLAQTLRAPPESRPHLMTHATDLG
jgi:transposase